MPTIITDLIIKIQYLLNINLYLFNMVARFIPLKQFLFDDTKSPSYQKFKTDKLPVIKMFEKQDFEFLLEYYFWRYKKILKPVNRRGKTIPEDTTCPRCNATHHYIYDNNGGNGEFLCKVCGSTFVSGKKVTTPLTFACPYCGRTLQPTKDRKHFRVHKCVYQKCSYYLSNLKKLPQNLPSKDKYQYKLHYIYREFCIDFFKIDLNSIPDRLFGMTFRKESSHIMGLCLTYHVNLQLSLRKTAQALQDIHGVNISHTMVANYAKTASSLIKPFVDNFDYTRSDTFIADETYIKIRGDKGYVWLIMDAVSRSILGYQVSYDRGVGACILTMRMAFRTLKELPKKFKFIADGYSAYPLAAQQFALRKDNPLVFDVTQVIGLTNDDAVSEEFRPFKQMVERLNRTFKSSYRNTCGYDSLDGANYSVSLWVCYYNFLRPHTHNNFNVLNNIKDLESAKNMQNKWQLLLLLGQQAILDIQSAS